MRLRSCIVLTRESYGVFENTKKKRIKILMQYHLSSSHAYGLDGKLATAHIKQVFQTRTKEVNDLSVPSLRQSSTLLHAECTHEDVVQALLAKVVDLGDSSWKQNHPMSQMG